MEKVKHEDACIQRYRSMIPISHNPNETQHKTNLLAVGVLFHLAAGLELPSIQIKGCPLILIQIQLHSWVCLDAKTNSIMCVKPFDLRL
jgi:hypothetical protein